MKFSVIDTVHDIKWAIQDLFQVSKDFKFRDTFDFDPDSYDLFYNFGKLEEESWPLDSYVGVVVSLLIGIIKTEEKDSKINEYKEDSKYDIEELNSKQCSDL